MIAPSILPIFGPSRTGLSRWQRISLVRDLANAKLQDGDSTVSARYARERKHSALELLEKARHKARDIFDRQVCPPVIIFSLWGVARLFLGVRYCQYVPDGHQRPTE